MKLDNNQQLLSFGIIIITIMVACHAKPTYPEGLWPLRIFGKFMDESEQKILAYFDFNRDRYVDILTQSFHENLDSQNQPKLTTILNLYIWNKDKQIFQLTQQQQTGAFIYQSALISDLDENSRIDIIFTTKNQNNKFIMIFNEIACIDKKCVFYAKEQLMKDLTPIQYVPAVFHIKGRNSLIYKRQQQVFVKYLAANSKQLVQKLFTTSFLAGQSQSKVCPCFEQVLYLDYDGDCIQDLVVLCKHNEKEVIVQFFKGQPTGHFNYHGQEYLNTNKKVYNIYVAIKDINYDGLPDILVLNWHQQTTELFLQIYYNRARKSVLQTCKVTTTTSGIPFDFITEEQLAKDILFIQKKVIKPQSVKGQYILRLGDINNDGFQDLIIDGQDEAILLENVACDSKCTKEPFNQKFTKQWAIFKIRNFVPVQIKYSAVQAKHLCSLSFFDFYEDGHLDMIASQCGENGKIGRVLPILNSLAVDAFFMKVLVLDNLEDQKVKESTLDFRINSNGGHIDMYVTSLSGQRIPLSGDQLSNPGQSLQLPYIHLGLGRTNNYVQQLGVSLNRQNIVQSYIWTPIVPNSQLLIVPGPKKWTLKTFISPTQVMGIVFWFVVLILIVMGVYIAYLTKKQKQEDKQNQQNFYTILR